MRERQQNIRFIVEQMDKIAQVTENDGLDIETELVTLAEPLLNPITRTPAPESLGN